MVQRERKGIRLQVDVIHLMSSDFKLMSLKAFQGREFLLSLGTGRRDGFISWDRDGCLSDCHMCVCGVCVVRDISLNAFKYISLNAFSYISFT